MAAMSDAAGFARELLDARPDRFAAVLPELPPDARFAIAAGTRRAVALARAARASYVLCVGGEPSAPGSWRDPALAEADAEALEPALPAYRALHLAGTFGHTGQLTAVERAPRVAEAVREAAERHALAERVRVHAGDPVEIVRALNGPHDFIVLHGRWREQERMAADLTRLLRVGGSLLAANASLAADPDGDPEAAALRRFLAALAADERYLLDAGPEGAVLAVRVR